ncbi:M3 family oligoendopeptidase [Candidatus Xianfuyuplasma coldseepsis]|uniref:M3 family oligoendopeptidase n=1 Tax=Candidatus Xianfuyuplasma coldseepsis TaxID=2782163 RepID=A0A7L7KSE1_9MOLU|nr:M3 family oligoendopeptidase [Xianfuyuplasma coldseepsis]QMS84864.1 M3 family oligoendopeptidase [Xianfuyuplasma coldseepsis]
MKFSEFTYERPDLEQYKAQMTDILNKMKDTPTVGEELALIKSVFDLQDELSTMAGLVSTRHSIDTRDEFYEKEQQFFNENIPHLQQYDQQFSIALLESKNRKALEQEFGTLLFDQAELQRKTFSEEIIPELQLENKLSMEYQKLLSSAKIEFKDGTYNLSQMRPFTQDLDRQTRHDAQLVVSKWFEDHEKEIDDIYDKMVEARHSMAIKLGYENYVQLGYDKLGRTDYNWKDVKTYRDQIYQDVVPVVNELAERKGKRIGIDNPKSYDLTLSFLDGNPTPKGDSKWQLNVAKTMYEEMSPKTGEFINFMIDKELLELDAKEGKSGGGYCTYFPTFETPFIFANFNGTSGDVDVLTHEAGHAFQVYSSRHNIPVYRWPTLEAAEIHSMSMEFLAWPWIDGFFKEDTPKYKFDHLASALSFLPYGVAVDEFQHGIYENPKLTPDERKTLWRSIEKKYLPFKDYDDDAFLDKGTFWYRQGHIFGVPFYYIDYTLAQVVAFQYWIKSQENHSKALEEYIALCERGGSKSFVALLDSASLENPFIQGTVSKIVKPIKAYLDGIDDTTL